MATECGAVATGFGSLPAQVRVLPYGTLFACGPVDDSWNRSALPLVAHMMKRMDPTRVRERLNNALQVRLGHNQQGMKGPFIESLIGAICEEINDLFECEEALEAEDERLLSYVTWPQELKELQSARVSYDTETHKVEPGYMQAPFTSGGCPIIPRKSPSDDKVDALPHGIWWKRRMGDDYVQSSAMDVGTKLHKDVEQSLRNERIVLQTHDEIVVEVPQEFADNTAERCMQAMKSAVNLKDVKVTWKGKELSGFTDGTFVEVDREIGEIEGPGEPGILNLPEPAKTTTINDPKLYKCFEYGCPDRKPQPAHIPPVCYTCNHAMERVK